MINSVVNTDANCGTINNTYSKTNDNNESSSNSIWLHQAKSASKNKTKQVGEFVEIKKQEDGTYCAKYENEDGSYYTEETIYNSNDLLETLFLKVLHPEKTTKCYDQNDFLYEEKYEDNKTTKITVYDKNGTYSEIRKDKPGGFLGLVEPEFDMVKSDFDSDGFMTKKAEVNDKISRITSYEKDGSYSVQEGNTLIKYDKNDNKVGEYEVKNGIVKE